MCQIKQLNALDKVTEQDKYFPTGFAEETLPDQCGTEGPRLSEVERQWYPKHWRAACEPPLLDQDQPENGNQFKFRFSLLPSFDNPLIFRMESRQDGHWLVVKQLTGHGGYDPGIIGRTKEFELSRAEIDFVRDKLNRIRASRADALARFEENGPSDTCFAMFDGTQWILEVVEDDQYDMFTATSPTNGDLHELGTMLMRKSGWIEL